MTHHSVSASFTPRRILITGASRGIGACLAQGLLAQGHKVIATSRRSSDLDFLGPDLLQDPNRSLLKAGLDVCKSETIEQVAELVDQHWGGIDVLINNAGIADSAPLHKTPDEMWDRLIEINLTGCFKVTRRFLGDMKRREYGRVIFISSIAGLSGCLYTSAYCASKHGVIGLMRALALEVAPTSITANAICPGFVETDMAHDAMDQITSSTGRSEVESRKALEAFSPQKRLIQPEEILHLTQFLIADQAKGINGQALTVDGGQVMH